MYTSPVDDMVRDKFVFSTRDLQIKERLLGPKEQNNENPTVDEIRADAEKENPSRRLRPG